MARTHNTIIPTLVRSIVQPEHLAVALASVGMAATSHDAATAALASASASACLDLNWALHRALSTDRGLERARSTLKTLERLQNGDLRPLASVGLPLQCLSQALEKWNGVHPAIAALKEAQNYRRLLDPDWTISDDSDRVRTDVGELAAIAARQYRGGIDTAYKTQKTQSELLPVWWTPS